MPTSCNDLRDMCETYHQDVRQLEAIDLTSIYSANKLAKGQIFKTGDHAIHFIKDYCFNHNRQCKVTKSSGRRKTYACFQDGCPWEIRLTKRERVGESP